MKTISFYQRLFVMMCCSVLFIVAVIEVKSYNNISSVRVESMKSLALAQAQLIASNRNLQLAAANEDKVKIADIMAQYQVPPGLDYFSISDTNRYRMFHSAGRGIGKPLFDANLEEIRTGHHIALLGTGIEHKMLIKARVPLFYQGEFAGIVSVGMNYQQAVKGLGYYFRITIIISGLVLLFCLFISQRFTNYIRKQMRHQSPQQIEMALKLRQGILNSVYEGVIATDSQNRILVANNSAMKQLNILDDRDTVYGSKIADYLYPTSFFNADNDDEVTDEQITCNGEDLIANRRFMFDDQGNKTGTVVSFRVRREKEELEQTINAVIQDKENLRAIIHEFNNQMAVIYGLLQMKHYQKAMNFIQSEHTNKQHDIYQVSQAFKVPTLVALVLSKISRAKELGVRLEVDPLSSIHSDELPISENKLACIVGNLINNAFDAIVRSEPETRVVRLFIQQGSDFIIEVEDSGDGVKDEDVEHIFERGVTAKQSPDHGVGLSLVQHIVSSAHGTIIVDESEWGGALFSIYIPMAETASVAMSTQAAIAAE